MPTRRMPDQGSPVMRVARLNRSIRRGHALRALRQAGPPHKVALFRRRLARHLPAHERVLRAYGVPAASRGRWRASAGLRFVLRVCCRRCTVGRSFLRRIFSAPERVFAAHGLSSRHSRMSIIPVSARTETGAAVRSGSGRAAASGFRPGPPGCRFRAMKGCAILNLSLFLKALCWCGNQITL